MLRRYVGSGLSCHMPGAICQPPRGSPLPAPYGGDTVGAMNDAAPPTAAQLDEVVAVIDRRLRPAAILLYGSAATGQLRPDSDVDIAVLLGRRSADPFELAALRTDIEARLGRDVDLVALETASPILAMEVLRQHRILVNNQPQLLENFIVKTLGAYFDLKQVRQPIEEAILRYVEPT